MFLGPTLKEHLCFPWAIILISLCHNFYFRTPKLKPVPYNQVTPITYWNHDDFVIVVCFWQGLWWKSVILACRIRIISYPITCQTSLLIFLKFLLLFTFLHHVPHAYRLFEFGNQRFSFWIVLWIHKMELHRNELKSWKMF